MYPFDLGNFHPKMKGSIIDNVSIDSREVKTKKTLFVALLGKKADGHRFVLDAFSKGATFAIVHEDWKCPSEIEHKLLRVRSTHEALQELASCYRASINPKVVALAGSLGKTMLKDLLAHLWTEEQVFFSPESYNNQVGVALSLLSIPSPNMLSFIEMAATEPHEMEKLVNMASPEIAIITNFIRHRFGSMDQKKKVVDELTFLMKAIPHSGYILGEADRTLSLPSCNFYPWNEEHKDLPTVSFEKDLLCCTFPDGSHSEVRFHYTKSYLVELVTLAIKASYKLGLDKKKILERLSSWQPEVMRTEIWTNKEGTSFVNSTYSETTLSFDSSLQDFATYTAPLSKHATKNILLFGGFKGKKPEETDLRVLDSIESSSFQELHVYPKALGNHLSPYLKKIPIHIHETLEESLEALSKEHHATIFFKGKKKIPFDWLVDKIEESPPNTLATINLAAIKTNIQLLREKLIPSTRIMIMVKALAYGTDDVRLAHFLKSCSVDILGVSYVDEGVHLRKMGVTQSIFVVHASEFEMEKAIHWNLEVGVSSLSQIEAAEEAASKSKKSFPIHLHVDTGMKRFGCSPQSAKDYGYAIKSSKHLLFEGLFTHFAVSDEPKEDVFTIQQANTLISVKNELLFLGIQPTYTHAANSSAAIRFSFPEFNMVRIGLATYGFHTSDASLSLLPLRPALSLYTKIVGFNDASRGDTVSYGRCHTIQKEKTRLAVLPVGYYDGLHRIYSGKGHVMIRGILAPMVGRICMDYMMVDVSHIEHVEVGDTALLFGEDESGSYLSPEKLAHSGGSIVHELMTCLGPRVQRLFIYDESLATR